MDIEYNDSRKMSGRIWSPELDVIRPISAISASNKASCAGDTLRISLSLSRCSLVMFRISLPHVDLCGSPHPLRAISGKREKQIKVDSIKFDMHFLKTTEPFQLKRM